MRRRFYRATPEPPARLRAFDPAEWLPLVDVLAYGPDGHRNRTACRTASRGFRCALGSTRRPSRCGRARLAWHQEYGWPGGLSPLDLLRQERAARLGRTIQ